MGRTCGGEHHQRDRDLPDACGACLHDRDRRRRVLCACESWTNESASKSKVKKEVKVSIRGSIPKI